MVFTHRSLLNIDKRILLYLLKNSFQIESSDATEDLTAFGIADGVFSDRKNISNNLKKLKNMEYLDEISAHIKGKKRKQRIYYLTDIGRIDANEIKEDLFNKEITIINPDQNIMRLKFPEISKYLEENDICQGITDLETCKLINYKNIFDVNLISTLKKNFIHFIDDALEPRYFFGRVKELYQLKKLIDNKNLYKVIVIHGLAGIGKTTLVSKLIKDYIDFKNIFWHKCNKWDTERSILLHLTQFLSKTNEDYLKIYINFSKPLDPDKITYLLKEKMKGVNALFIFDDFHKVNEELRNFFMSLIDVIGEKNYAKFIILSRYIFPFYDQQDVLVRKSVFELELRGLDYKSSKELLQKKSIAKINYRKIYNNTSGNPLLLEIIDSNKKISRYIYDEIFSQFSEEERMILERLSIYRLPIPYEAFFINDKILPDSINNLTQKLIIKETSDGLYYTHEFIKDYFYKRLNPYKKHQYHNLCGKFYMKQKTPKDYIESLYHYIKSQQYKIAIDLALKKAQNIIDQGLSERFLALIEELPEEEVLLPQWDEILVLKGQLCFIIGEWDKSLQYYHQAIEIGIEFGKKDITAKAYCEIGHILEEKNLFDNAVENFQKCLEISKKLSDSKLLAEAKRGVGRYYWRKSDYKNAEKYFKDSLKALKNIDDFKLIGTIYIDLGNVYFSQNKITQAIKWYKNSLKMLKKVNYKNELIRAYNNLGTVFLHNRKLEEALKCYEQQLELAEAVGDIRGLGYVLSNIGYCYSKLNLIEKAESFIKRAKKISNMLSDENMLYTIFNTYGLIHKFRKNWEKAIRNFNKSIKIIKKLDMPIFLVETLFDFGLLYEEKGDSNNAKKFYQEAYSVYQEMGWSIPNQLKAKLSKFNRT